MIIFNHAKVAKQPLVHWVVLYVHVTSPLFGFIMLSDAQLSCTPLSCYKATKMPAISLSFLSFSYLDNIIQIANKTCIVDVKYSLKCRQKNPFMIRESSTSWVPVKWWLTCHYEFSFILFYFSFLFFKRRIARISSLSSIKNRQRSCCVFVHACIRRCSEHSVAAEMSEASKD